MDKHETIPYINANNTTRNIRTSGYNVGQLVDECKPVQISRVLLKNEKHFFGLTKYFASLFQVPFKQHQHN